jgi:hypothetical protein
MALSPVSLTLKQKIFVNSKKFFFTITTKNEKTDILLIYGEYGKNSVSPADVYKPMVDTSNTFYINLIY